MQVLQKTRRLVRRGHVRTTNLSMDAWQLVWRHADPLHVILLSMTCTSMRDRIKGDHELWRRLFIMWEWVTGGFWIPNTLASPSIRPEGLPPIGWHLDDITNKAEFNASVKKVIVLHYVKRCGLCGQSRRRTDPVWALNMRVCENCWRANLISNRTLYVKYGVTLTTRLSNNDTQTLIEKCFGSVLYFIFDGPESTLKHYSYQPCDFDNQYRQKTTIFFWEPHLRKVVNLDELYQRKQARIHTAQVLTGFVRRHRVQRAIQSTYKHGVSDGFKKMKPSAKKAVLNVLHRKHHLPLARRDYHRVQRRLHHERLFHDTSGLFTATKAYMCGKQMRSQ